MGGGKGNIKPEDNPKPFKKGQIANPNGRPKKYVTRFATEYGITGYNGSEIKDCFAIVLEMTRGQRKSVLETDDADGLIQVACRVVEKAIAKGDFKEIKDLVEFVGGKAIQKVATTDTEGNDIIPEGLIISVGIEPKQVRTSESDIKDINKEEAIGE